jgi:carbamoylphosphate synthase small subunit
MLNVAGIILPQVAPNHLTCRQKAPSAMTNIPQATKVVLYTKSLNSVAANLTTKEIIISSNNHHLPITKHNLSTSQHHIHRCKFQELNITYTQKRQLLIQVTHHRPTSPTPNKHLALITMY